MLRFVQTIVLVGFLSAVIGAVGFFAVWYLRDVSFVGNIVEQTRDIVQAIEADRFPPSKFKTPIVIVNFDEEAFESLGRPLPMRKEAVAKILRILRDMQPKAVVIDIDLSWKTSLADEQQLLETLASWPATAGPLLLVRELSGVPYSVRKLASTSFDSLLATGRNTRWVTAQGIESASDRVLRRMENASLTCIGETPYLAEGVVLAVNSDALPPLPVPQPWSCPPTISDDVSANPPPIDGIRDYVHFSMRWDPKATMSVETVVINGSSRPLVTVVSALPFLSAAASPVASDLFENAIVIVGAANTGSGDFRQTPVGFMPGFFVIANHIRGTIEHPSESDNWLGGMLISVVFSVSIGIVCLMFQWTSSPLVQLFGPLALTALWWISYAFVLGGGIYIGLMAVQAIAGIVSTLAASRRGQ